MFNIDSYYKMIDDKKNIDRLETLFFELKKYIELRSDLVKLDLTEKLTRLLSVIVLFFIFILVGLVILFNASFALAYAINSHLHDLVASFAIVGGVFFVIAFGIYCMRERLITQPIVNFIARLILEKKNKKES